MERKEIILSDMSICKPSDGVSRKAQQGCWELIDYETKDGLKGTMMFADPNDNAAEVELPLNVSGSYQIYIGIHYTKHQTGFGNGFMKLSDDLGFTTFDLEADGKSDGLSEKTKVNPRKLKHDKNVFSSIYEVFWRTADLTGQSLQLRSADKITNLSYVRLVPASEQVLEYEQKLCPREDTKRVSIVGMLGGLSGSTRGNPMKHVTDMQEFRDILQPYIDSDFKTLHFAAIRGNLCTFQTKVGDVGTPDNHWSKDWIDPLRALTDLAHEHDMQLYCGLRMIGAANPVIRHPINWARFYFAHPQWAMKDRDGIPIARSSLAFPEVRHHWQSLLRESLEYGVDGLTLLINRSMPIVMYEEPTVQAFIDKYGDDPRKLPENDPRWQEHAAGYVTQFIREVKAMVNEYPGRKLAVLFKGYSNPQAVGIHNTSDVETWIKEGLVDILMPQEKVASVHLQRWRELTGDRIELWPGLSKRKKGNEIFKEVRRLYDADVDGVHIWDGDGHKGRITEWNVYRRLGHLEMLDELEQQFNRHFRRIPLKSLGGISMEHRFRDG